MKLRTTMLLVLILSAVALASSYDPYDISFGEQLANLTRELIFLAFVTPFGWGAMFVIGYLIVTMSVKGGKKLATTDYSEMKRKRYFVRRVLGRPL